MTINEHTVLENGFEYEIVGFKFQKDIKNEIESYIDITLQKNEEIKQLRFLSPINIKIENGFHMSYGFRIIDSSDKFLDHKIEVENFEDGSIYFRARKVVDLDKTTETELEVLSVEFAYNLER